MEGRSCRLELDLASDGSEDMAGAGTIGDAIGITTWSFTTTTGITPTVRLSITGMPTTVVDMEVRARLAKQDTGHRPQITEGAEECTTGPGHRRGRSREIATQRAATVKRTGRPACIREHSMAMTTAENRKATRREGLRACRVAGEAGPMAAGGAADTAVEGTTKKSLFSS